MRICFVSRVEQSKCLDTLLKVAHRIYELQLDGKISIDFFVQKNDGYFDNNIASIQMFTYKGVLHQMKLYRLLSNTILLFSRHIMKAKAVLESSLKPFLQLSRLLPLIGSIIVSL